MAIEIPRNLYTAGAVQLDASPSVNLYAQIQAKREAQEQAKQATFDEYLRNLNKNVTSAGKRIVDTEAFQDKYNRWQRFGLENRDKLLKNDVNTRMQFEKGYQDLVNFVNESKAEEEKKKPLVEIMFDPEKRKKLSSNVIESIALHDQPLYVKDENGNYVRNEKRRSIDYNSNLFDPQFDMAKAFPGWATGMKMSKDIGEIIQRDPVTGQVIRGFTERYDPDQIKQISLNAARSVEDNSEYKNYYQHRYETLKDDEYKRLNEAFQNVYGKTIKMGLTEVPNFIDSPAEVAAADAILQAQSLTKKGEEAVMDRELANQRSINKIYISDSLIRGRKGSGTDEETLADYDIFKNYEPKFVNKKVKVKNPNGWGTVEVDVKAIPANEVDVNDKKLFGDVKPVTGADGSKFYIVREDLDWEGANGQVISRDNVARRNMDQTAINEVKRGRLSSGIAPNKTVPKASTYTYNGKNYTKEELLKGGWTEDQINKAVKAGKLK